MNFEYEIDHEKGFITERFFGKVYVDELMDGLGRLFGDPAYRNHYHGLVDLSEASLLMDYRDVSKLVKFQKESPQTSTGQWGFLAASDLNFGVLRIYHSLMYDQAIDLLLFKTEAQARAWQAKLIRETTVSN